MNFFALQLLFFAFAFAAPDTSLPRNAVAMRRRAILSQDAAYQFVAFLCRCRGSHSCSTPWLLITLPSHALAAPCLSRQCRYKAYRLDSELFLCRTRVFSALPLLHSSMRFLCAAPRLKAVPQPCHYQQFRAVPWRSEPERTDAIALSQEPRR